MKAMKVMEYIEELRLHTHRFSSLCLIVSASNRILITLQEIDLMVRTSTATSPSGPSRPLNTSSRKKHLELIPLLPIGTLSVSTETVPLPERELDSFNTSTSQDLI